MATTKHIWAYLGVVVLVTWLANGIIPELQAGQIPISDSWAWLVRSLVPALVAITVLLPSVVQKPPGVPDVPTTAVPALPTRPLTSATPTPDPVRPQIVYPTLTQEQMIQPLAPTVPPPAIPDPTKAEGG